MRLAIHRRQGALGSLAGVVLSALPLSTCAPAGPEPWGRLDDLERMAFVEFAGTPEFLANALADPRSDPRSPAVRFLSEVLRFLGGDWVEVFRTSTKSTTGETEDVGAIGGVLGLFQVQERSPIDRTLARWYLDTALDLAFAVGFGLITDQWGVDGARTQESGVLARGLLVDRFEVTQAEWLRWRGSGEAVEGELLLEHSKGWGASDGRHPATFMDHGEARAFAAWKGMRLPTPEEWLHIARGPHDRRFPWGSRWRISAANSLDLGASGTLPVGTFESGATDEGVYDVYGNVWEWTSRPPRLAIRDLESAPVRLDVPVVLGGSHATRLQTAGITRDGLPVVESRHPWARGDDVGLRCVVGARTWLERHGDACLASRDGRRRLVAVGRRWGLSAVPFLLACGELEGLRGVVDPLLEGARP